MPFEPPWSAQTKPEGQPAVEQSPAWQALSAPQTRPFAQSVGFAQAPVVGVVVGVPDVNAQVWLLVQVYPDGQSLDELHVHVLHWLWSYVESGHL
jgi:hypothetical protein